MVAHGECPCCGSKTPVELAARVIECERTLVMVRDAIVEKAACTFWLNSIETVVDRIEAVLGEFGNAQPELPLVREPFLTDELTDPNNVLPPYKWHAGALHLLARQLGVGNDFYYPLIGAAKLLMDGATIGEPEIFVFGSNLAGRHGAGAALYARNHYGAVYGVANGRTGNAYAIPTKDAKLRTLPLNAIAGYVQVFLHYAVQHPNLTFKVTAIGTGLAGYGHRDIAPMFRGAPGNCLLPEEWKGILA